MTELEFGAVVKSKLGRDRHRLFIVTDTDYNDSISRVVIANGSLRRISDGKHKNPIHLLKIAELSESEKKELKTDFTDAKISEILKKYDLLKNK